jgi:hypothetical protein
MAFFNPYFATRRWLKLGLTVAGVLAGAVFGILLTRLGKIAAGAPPATLFNYAWNAAVFAVLGGIMSPLVTWSTLRNVPLWRTIAEPLIWAVAGAGVAIIVGVPVLLLLLPPAGLALGIVNLDRRYPQSHAHILPPSDDAESHEHHEPA